MTFGKEKYRPYGWKCIRGFGPFFMFGASDLVRREGGGGLRVREFSNGNGNTVFQIRFTNY